MVKCFQWLISPVMVFSFENVARPGLKTDAS
jgi:hypothetical protein